MSALSDFSTSHRRHHEYSHHLPGPPRISVPPPQLSDNLPYLQVADVADRPGEELDTAFLRAMKLDTIVQRDTLLNWTYAQRRDAQMILPWLFLGPLNAAKDREFLRRNGITMTIAVRSHPNSMKGALEVGREVCHEVATIEAPDNAKLVCNFSRATTLINQHVAKIRHLTATTLNPRMGTVLVFCESGNERSAAVVAAYLMEMLDNFDHIKSMQACQAQRFCINFDDGIKTGLRAYWDILQARRAVARSSAELQSSFSTLQLSAGPAEVLPPSPGPIHAPPALASKQKRTIADTLNDEDVDMDDGIDPDDVLRFDGRDNRPFEGS